MPCTSTRVAARRFVCAPLDYFNDVASDIPSLPVEQEGSFILYELVVALWAYAWYYSCTVQYPCSVLRDRPYMAVDLDWVARLEKARAFVRGRGLANASCVVDV